MSEQDKQTCNILCIVSAILFGLPLITDVSGFILNLLTTSELVSNILSNYSSIFFGLTGMFQIAGIVLMIIARVKYPQSVFAKVLMWVYIAMIILYIILMILVVIALVAICSACGEAAQSCGFIIPALLG